ncbi:MAG: lysine--tRNA ligase [Planctomycetes bacterium]|nr:lysine--tRNA ligase [Planctomycetota bacterium]MCG2684433.1 lysine--tRNA ligase [Planctomycetales bacterium]
MSEPPPQPPAGSETALEAARREKLRKIRELGIDPWGSRFDGHQPIGEIRAREGEIVVEPAGDCQTDKPPEQHGPRVRAAGRIVLRRPSGKVHWLQIRDWSGAVQAMIGKVQVGQRNFELAKCFDLGDIVGVDGELKRTRTGELTIFAEDLKFLAKSIATPPEKHKGLADPELRQRMRYLDLIHTDGVLETFLRRTKIVESIRRTLGRRGFVEVEGPTLHAIAGGAAARPFITHHNALDIDLYLRIALELHLKRLLVGGIERVYELGRVYRNEGIDARHNPEFTMLEVYQAYGDYETMMDLTEAIVVDAIRAMDICPLSLRERARVRAVDEESPHPRPLSQRERGESGPLPQRERGELTLPWGEKEIDFTPPFPRKTYDELFAEHTGLSVDDAEGTAKLAERIGFDTAGKHPDVVKNFVFEEKVEIALDGPIFVIDYPASICPLTKRKADNPAIAERFELFIQGMEVANAYTELNDPDLQEELLGKQLDGLPEEESMAKMDRDFIRALRHGMPPAGGLGVGIDRLVMLLTDSQSIREVILFPLLRPEKEDVS